MLIGSNLFVTLLAMIVIPFAITAIVYIISMHPYLIGIRIGLRVLGFRTDPSQKRLLIGATGYGLLEAIVAFIFTSILFAGSLILLRSEVGLLTALQVDPTVDPIATLSRELAFGAITVLSFLSAVAVMALRAAILPALANFAAGRSPNGVSYSSIDGFGSNLITMMALLLMITGISAVIIPFAGDAFGYLGLTNVLTNELGDIVLFVFDDKDVSFTMLHAFMVAAAILVSIWLFCLQCAGAALSYASRAAQSAASRNAAVEAQHARSEDIGALLRSRMQKHQK
ncbi:hypothetical protein [Yoonia maritima]|uniref:hypothetical protein n=1 Tax=Yoonia maritima TaxID=1435347 RepID=UPI0013A63C62|nr:hypothetical protein [Yoonia maritima]